MVDDRREVLEEIVEMLEDWDWEGALDLADKHNISLPDLDALKTIVISLEDRIETRIWDSSWC